ncbi:hypothetical protein SKAU_G00328380 [Synaphobranchus kaupii]|uniref:Uncharacterized protein n=1 Tax=Synaphobranchus kaupii TaxID=118154 RepID=A0A9Q1EQ58_SYNKA|nr:hypothetical protein SKAU_G00328380 [Synaphobranchus kaupii]
MAVSASEEKTFRRFLELFLREVRGPLQDEEPLPMRPLSDLVSEDEYPRSYHEDLDRPDWVRKARKGHPQITPLQPSGN